MIKVFGICIAPFLTFSHAWADLPAISKSPVFGVANLQSQLVKGSTQVASNRADGFMMMQLRVTIDAAGRVLDAEPYGESVGRMDPAAAVSAARSWLFRPQTFQGHAVVASGLIQVIFRPNEDPRPPRSRLPKKAANFQIELARSACLGSCPVYHVTIRANGSVLFTSDQNKGPNSVGAGLLLPGTHEAGADRKTVARLFAMFQAARFFGLKSSYRALMTDNPTQTLTMRMGSASKVVEDYAGEYVGMPKTITDLENAVDAAADTARWVTGDARTVPYLVSKRFDFRSREAADLALTALRNSRYIDHSSHASRLVLELIDRGLPLDMEISADESFLTGHTQSHAGLLGAKLAYEAALNGRDDLFARLDQLGYTKRMDRADVATAFALGSGCSPLIATALVRAGADPATNARGTAISAIHASYNVCGGADDNRLIAMTHTLIKLGVPIDGRDTSGYTALMFANSPGYAQLLIEHGADLNARAADGLTPLLTTSDDRVALLLLQAGADPKASRNGYTVRSHAFQSNMPQTVAWLNAHSIAD